MILKGLQSPLTELAFYSDLLGHEVLEDLSRYLERFKDSLQVLTTSIVTFKSASIQFPNLTTLSIHDCPYGQIYIQFIYLSFPNLRKLEYWPPRWGDPWSSQVVAPEILRGPREINHSSQDRGRWESLEYLEGPLESLYVLAIRSKVQEMDLLSSVLDTAHGNAVAAVLRDAQPSCLYLSVRLPQFDPLRLGEFLAPVEKTLVRLHLRVELSGDEYTGLDTMLVSLRPVYRFL